MKLFHRLLCVSILLCVAAVPLLAQDKTANRYVKITVPFVNVYQFLDPKSTVLKQAKQGEKYPLVSIGTSWYQIQVDANIGWVEQRSAELVDHSSTLFDTAQLVIFFAVAIGFVGTIIAVIIIISRQRELEAEEV